MSIYILSFPELTTYGCLNDSLCTSDYSGSDNVMYSVADKSLARPGKKQATATEDFDVHISYL